MITTIESGNSYCLQLKTLNENHYWFILPNRNPLPDTLLNTPQIVDKCKYLESKILDQADELEKLKLQMQKTNCVVEQLLGGLFCQKTQSSILHTHLAVLRGDEVSESVKETEDTHSSAFYPTTRQGDQNAQKIETLELQNKTIAEMLWDLTGKEVFVYEPTKDLHSDCDSISTHSSMPSLISDNDECKTTGYEQLYGTYCEYYEANTDDYENNV